MDPTIGVLCAVVLCLTAYIVWKRCEKPAVVDEKPAEQMHPGSTRASAGVRASPETRATSENIEHFSAVTDDSVGAASEFGGTGGDFRDWAMSQAVDAQVLVNHREFVKDRFGNNNQNITGRTFAMGEVEGTDQVPWQGILGRPQAVESYNPTQQPDVDMRNFAEKRRFRWGSV